MQMSMAGDIIPSTGTSFFGENLTAFVENGTIAEARLDDMAEASSWLGISSAKTIITPRVSASCFCRYFRNPVDQRTIDTQ